MLKDEGLRSRELEKALQALEQAKLRVINEKKRLNKQRLEAQRRHRNMIGEIVAKYLPDCYLFEESEMDRILSAALKTRECGLLIQNVKENSAYNDRPSPAAAYEASEGSRDEDEMEDEE